MSTNGDVNQFHALDCEPARNFRTTQPENVRQATSMNILLQETCNLSLSGLETYYFKRFHVGEIREMKQEFDNMCKATVERHRMAVTARENPGSMPEAPCMNSTMLEDLITRFEAHSSSSVVDSTSVQKTLSMLMESKSESDQESSIATPAALTNRSVYMYSPAERKPWSLTDSAP